MSASAKERREQANVAVILGNGRATSAASSEVTPAAATGHGGIVFDGTGPVAPPAQATFTPGARGLATDWPQGSGLGGGAVVVSVYLDMMCPIAGSSRA